MRAVNLIPSERRPGGVSLAGRSGGAAYIVVALICGLALLALLYGMASHEIGAKQAEANRLSAEASKAQSEASELAPYTSFATMRDERLKDVQELANTRFDWAHVMHELGRVLPRGASLSSVTATIGASTTGASTTAPAPASPSATAASSVTSATPAGSTPSFEIAGCATSQSEVALTMNRLRLIDGVSEVSLQSSTKSGGSTGGSCPSDAPVFEVQVSFDALPAPTVTSAPAGGASSASDSTSSSGASAGSKGSSEVQAR
jgi:Tfp pilus assembly protein PilN